MTNTPPRLRINRLEIQNYKKIDHLEIEFPLPLMEGDPDIFILGSKNGGGKTSVLECCALITFQGISRTQSQQFKLPLKKFSENLIQSGSDEAQIRAEYIDPNYYTHQKETEWTDPERAKQASVVQKNITQDNGERSCSLSLSFDRRSGISWPRVEGNDTIFRSMLQAQTQNVSDYANSMLAISSEPLIHPPLLYFNSYRKVAEFNPELGMMAEGYAQIQETRASSKSTIGSRSTISSFKMEVLRALMGKAALFKGLTEDESQTILSQLNELLRRYCDGEIDQLQLLPDNTVDLRIQSMSSGSSYSFNGLSSGQKEIIATLFLIWKYTIKNPSIVLIDEPELHLNAEWHRSFIYQLHRLAPQNQYIIATHSEQIFGSVEARHRAILEPDTEEEI